MAETVMVALCPAEDVDRVWIVVSPLLAPAVDYCGGRHEIDDIYFMVCSSKVQLWAILVDTEIVAACISELKDYTAKRMLSVLFVGGSKMESWLSLLIEKLKKFAAYNDADALEMLGREGWSRILSKHGFVNRPCVLMEMAL